MPCNRNCNQGRNCTCEAAAVSCSACTTPRPDCMGAVVPGIGDHCGAITPRLQRWFRLEFECDSTPIVWEGLANNQAAAETVARADLAHDWAFFNSSAKLTRCVEGADL
jgi:hypothetical protein